MRGWAQSSFSESISVPPSLWEMVEEENQIPYHILLQISLDPESLAFPSLPGTECLSLSLLWNLAHKGLD